MRIRAQQEVNLKHCLPYECGEDSVMVKHINDSIDYKLNTGILGEMMKFTTVKEEQMEEYPFNIKKSIEVHIYTDEEFREIFRLMGYLYKMQGLEGKEIMEQIKQKLDNN